MSHSAEISRSNPTCFLFLVDQSGSMADSFGTDPGIQKAQFVSDALNKIFQNLVIRCAKSEGIRDFFWIGVIGYGERVGPALSGSFAERELVPISEIAANPARVEERTRKESDGAGGIVEVNVKFPVWFDPRAGGGTPMCQALSLAYSILERWVAEHPDSHPPIAMHLTDGESTDGDPAPLFERIRSLGTRDGNVLLLNCHASSTRSDRIRFPSSTQAFPTDPFAKPLFDHSSVLPETMATNAKNGGYVLEDDAKGFVFNGSVEDVVDFLDIGTRPSNLR